MAITVPIIDNRPKQKPIVLSDFSLRLAELVAKEDEVESNDEEPDPRAKVIRGALTLYHQMLINSREEKAKVRRITRGYFRVEEKKEFQIY